MPGETPIGYHTVARRKSQVNAIFRARVGKDNQLIRCDIIMLELVDMETNAIPSGDAVMIVK